jgi:co-chaperonin GroES (HSP10)
MTEKTENLSGIIPLNYSVLVLPEPVDDTITAPGGTKFFVADDYEKKRRKQAKQEKSIIIDIGSNSFEDWDVAPNIGAKVMIEQFAGEFCIGKDGIEYRLITDKEIKAILES